MRTVVLTIALTISAAGCSNGIPSTPAVGVIYQSSYAGPPQLVDARVTYATTKGDVTKRVRLPWTSEVLAFDEGDQVSMRVVVEPGQNVPAHVSLQCFIRVRGLSADGDTYGRAAPGLKCGLEHKLEPAENA